MKPRTMFMSRLVPTRLINSGLANLISDSVMLLSIATSNCLYIQQTHLALASAKLSLIADTQALP